ncbi:helix-turn-helix domain-containing protein [Vallitalea sp.]|jgi:transcriptional regulator with XRE-family HTH domain|uniref:helix-turn-helix domain-containing protein n=1 Tax=Vallitalea sp. TaxID=1882829 RepID=UPI0025D0B322|nr:helix-turn-helix domain-containing protein [Vallitalea sp.]MCT4686846.1 helix-turn-helix domain-containing protein [Vallitalea sp.]
MSTIGYRFKTWRIREKLTRKDINTIAGIPLSTIADIENDKTIPSGKTLIPLYEHYKLPITYILPGNENSTLSDDRKTLLNIYNNLDDINKKIAMSELKHILEIQELKKEQ